MRKHSIVNCLLTIFLIVFLAILLLACTRKEGSNDIAHKNKDRERYITIINDTDQIINEVHITVGDGTEINHAYRKNPDETSFSIPISKDYKEYDEFTVTLIDRYENEYIKTCSSVPEVGVTEIRITSEDITEEPSIWKKFEMFVNND